MKPQRKVVWPPMDEVSTPLVKKSKDKKPFVIESYSSWFGTWSVSRRYATAKQRDEAFDKLVKNSNHYIKDVNTTSMYRKVDL